MYASRRRVISLLSASALAACAGVEGEEAPTPAATPAEIEGPFYPADTNIERDADLTRLAGRTERAAGQVIEVRGRLLDRSGRPISGARIDLWQANAAGRYDHPRDSANPAPLDNNFQGYAALQTDAGGRFSVLTVKPGGYLVDAQGPRTPHFHWRIDAAGRPRLTTQSYFPDEPANDADFLIRAMRGDVRALIVQPGAAGAEGQLGFDWDVVLA